mgnify:CR=1 FL=1
MAEKLKIISLGGLDEIGKNMTVYEFGNDIIVVDCGMGFPDDDMYGIDVVIPDVSYLIKNQSKIRGIFITHGHEDHIGALPYVLRSINAPIYTTRMTAGLIRLKLEEHRLLDKTKIITCKAGDVVKAGAFSVEFIHVNHSIADAVAFAIKCPVGVCVHTGDFKIDTTPIQGGMIDLARFGELGKEGVLALLSDSTNVERPGYTRSERSVGASFDALFKGCEERIIVTTFASNVDRIQQIIDVAARYGRKVAVTGRSMENAMKVSTELGYMSIPDGVVMDLNHIKSLPKNKICIITTGSQGETMSALTRMAFSTHRQVDILPGDRIIISASAIPGNEHSIGNVINELYRKGAEVLNERELALHDYLVAWGEYDQTVYDARTPQGRADNTNPYGMLTGGYGICLGYATTFQLLMDLAEVECITVVGASSDSTGDHAWNMVRLEGEWYCVDPTWDDPSGDYTGVDPSWMTRMNHRYFNVTSDHMRRTNHQWDYRNVPEAVSIRFFWDGTGELPH